MPIDLMRRLISQLNLTELTNAYGMSVFVPFSLSLFSLTVVAETSPVSFQTTATDSLTKRVETVGKIMPHVKAKIVDMNGNVVPVGAPGELHVSGYLLQKGYAIFCRFLDSAAATDLLLGSYWDDPEQTQSVMKEDKEGVLWMHTGDEAIMDEEGYIRSECPLNSQNPY